MQLYALDDLYAVVRLEPDAEIPPWARTGHFWSVTRSDSELSIVCPQDPLADEQIPLFVVSTFETDYLLVREHDLVRSVAALTSAGHSVDG